MWKKGQSGNPGGKRRSEHRIKELAKQYTPECIETLVEIMQQREDMRSAVAAVTTLLAYGWGKPSQHVDLTNSDGSLASAWAAARSEMEAEEQEEAGVTH